MVYMDLGANHADTLVALASGNMMNFAKNGRFMPKTLHKGWDARWPAWMPEEGALVEEVDVYAVEPNTDHTTVLTNFKENFSWVKGMYTETGVWNETTELHFVLPGCKSSHRQNKVAIANKNSDQSKFEPGKVVDFKLGGDPQMDYEVKLHQLGAAELECSTSIKVVDVCELLRQRAGVVPNDFVAIKLDVESAEVVVLERISTGCVDLVDMIAFEMKEGTFTAVNIPFKAILSPHMIVAHWT